MTTKITLSQAGEQRRITKRFFGFHIVLSMTATRGGVLTCGGAGARLDEVLGMSGPGWERAGSPR
jgi:hypothetical protein